MGVVIVVQGGGLPGVTVAGIEVHAHCEVDLTASHDVVKEGVVLGHLTCVGDFLQNWPKNEFQIKDII